MSKLSPINYDKFVRKLRRAGYIPVRKNKHIIYFHPIKEITIPIPHKHPKDISGGMLNKLIKEMRISKEEFNSL
ncbi:type II toxin-antitoxin system HicA family toxin [Patescibacteria group bacterium]|nr:type II toxin-antitoxin system HicA family toxin [Patescibacteria group bacterium]